MCDEAKPRTLYVGNLDYTVTEDLVITLFGQLAPVKSCKIIHEPGNDPYCFVEFMDHQSAATALGAMNRRNFLGKEMKVNWATTPSVSAAKVDTKHFHVFVGDLGPDVEEGELRAAFAPFGEISDIKIVRDPQTLKSKGYGFVSFVNKIDAETAIASMNGQWIGTKKIRTNWATRKVQPTDNREFRHYKKLNFNEVYAQSSETNCTVYVGGVMNGLTDVMRKYFEPFGVIQEIRVFKDKGYAFVRYTSKTEACNAIVAMHGTEINGFAVKCSWGKESNDGGSVFSTPPLQPMNPGYNYGGYGGGYGNGYPGYPGAAAAAAAAANYYQYGAQQFPAQWGGGGGGGGGGNYYQYPGQWGMPADAYGQAAPPPAQ